MLLQRRGVQMIGGVEYLKIDDAGLHTRVGGEPRLFAVDTVIVCAGQTPLRALADGRSVDVPPTIEDPAVLDEIRAQLGSK